MKYFLILCLLISSVFGKNEVVKVLMNKNQIYKKVDDIVRKTYKKKLIDREKIYRMDLKKKNYTKFELEEFLIQTDRYWFLESKKREYLIQYIINKEKGID